MTAIEAVHTEASNGTLHGTRPVSGPQGRSPRPAGQDRGPGPGVTCMVQADRYCVDVLTQISAVTRALQEVALGLIDDHVRHCVLDPAGTGSADAAGKLDEPNAALRRAVRL